MNRNLLAAFTTTAVCLSIGGAAAGGAQAAANITIDGPALWNESTSVMDRMAEARTPAIGLSFEAEYPLSPISQQNAVRTAEDYLDFSAFSREGLIKQLEYDQFSTAEAVFAVDNITVDWNEQAAKAAQDYLDFSGFSHGGLISQLAYDGFTPAQAAYGVAAAGL